MWDKPGRVRGLIGHKTYTTVGHQAWRIMFQVHFFMMSLIYCKMWIVDIGKLMFR